MKELQELLNQKLKKSKINVDQIEFVNENSQKILRITIDKEELIDLDDCVFVNNIANEILEKDDLINEKYILEVCSKRKGGDKDGQ